MVCSAPHYYPPEKPKCVTKVVRDVEDSNLERVLDTQAACGWKIVSVLNQPSSEALLCVFTRTDRHG